MGVRYGRKLSAFSHIGNHIDRYIFYVCPTLKLHIVLNGKYNCKKKIENGFSFVIQIQHMKNARRLLRKHK